MPDIGLLQGAPVKPRVPPAPFLAPVDEAIAIVSAPLAEVAAPAPAAPSYPAPASILASAPGDSARVSAEPPRARGPRIAAPDPIRSRDLLWLAFALIIIVGTGIGVRDPWPADEPRFAALARDMALSHEWLFPRVGGDLYQDKPPLFFWLLAICYSLIGSVKWSFLIPSFLSACGIVFLVYDYGRRAVSREAGFAAALITLCTLQFVLTTRGAQIDATLAFLTTLSLYGLLRHLLCGPDWRWYFIGGFAAGLGVFTKGVGFLPVLLLIPFFVLRRSRWIGLAPIEAGAGGWRWWLAPIAMLLAISLWFVPMLIAVAASGSPEYIAYRDEILFKQTVGRYAASWHHVKSWYYFIVEVVPPLWLPFSGLLIWLVPRFGDAWRERDARVWLPLLWVAIVLVFFSLSPGKRGIYVHPALPALAIASLPCLLEVLGKASVKRAGFALAALFLIAAVILAVGVAAHAKFATNALVAANLSSATPVYLYIAICGLGLVIAARVAPLAAWPVALGSLTLVFSYWIAPAMNSERSGSGFVAQMLKQVKPGEELALVAYKEQFLLYLDRPTFNFGHRRWLEGPQESYDAAAWLNAREERVLLVPESQLKPCFPSDATPAGHSSDEEWFLVRGRATQSCAEKGDAARAIRYDGRDASR